MLIASTEGRSSFSTASVTELNHFLFRKLDSMMFGPVTFRDFLRDRGFVEFRHVETDREGLEFFL